MIFNMSGGGSASLNFKIIGGPTQRVKPDTPNDNTIWIDTEFNITESYLSTEAPASPLPGAVWITPSDDSIATFSAAKKHNIMMYPAFAAQYIDDSWVTVPAEFYQADSWLPFKTEVIVYEPGYFNTKLLGEKLGNHTVQTAGINFMHMNGLSHDKLIDMSRFRSIEISAKWSWRGIYIDVRDQFGTAVKSLAYGGGNASSGTGSLDISDLTGLHTIHLDTDDAYHASNYITVTGIKLKL